MLAKMLYTLKNLLRFLLYHLLKAALRLFVWAGRSVALDELEVAVLRHQLQVLRRQVKSPDLRPFDRAFLAAASRWIPRRRWSVFIVTPRTLLRWHQRLVARKVNGTVTQRFLYGSGALPIAELDAAGNVVSTFAYASRAHVPDFMTKGGVTYRIVSDHLGSPRLVVNTNDGTIAQRLDYDSFGNVTSDTNSGFQPFGFAGGLYDADTGLVRFGARDYDPRIGRFTTKDPIDFAGGDSNLYVYAYGNPINLVDPDGLEAAGLGMRGPMGHLWWLFTSSAYEHPTETCPTNTFGIGSGLINTIPDFCRNGSGAERSVEFFSLLSGFDFGDLLLFGQFAAYKRIEAMAKNVAKAGATAGKIFAKSFLVTSLVATANDVGCDIFYDQ